MPDDLHDFELPPQQERLQDILLKIVTYQHSLCDGRAVELDVSFASRTPTDRS